MDDDLEYLQPDFDPASFTVPNLRNILLKHEIDFPSGAKKAVLIEVFNEQLRPQAKAILAKYNRAKPSTRGIVDAAQYGTIGEPVTDTPRKRSTRRRTQAAVEDDDDEAMSELTSARSSMAPTPRKSRASSPVKRGGRRTTNVVPKEDSPEAEIEPIIEHTPKARKIRKSLVPPKTPEPEPEPVKDEEEEVIEIKDDVNDDEPAFSSDNPFQRGSPNMLLSPEKTSDRRKTLPLNESPRRKSTTARRKTDIMPTSRKSPSPFIGGTMSPPPQPPKIISVPIQRFKSMSPEAAVQQHYLNHQNNAIDRIINQVEEEEEPELLDLEPSEEFTPEEAAEVLQADALASSTAMGPLARRRNRPQESNHLGAKTLWTMLVMLLVGYGGWWRQEKLQVGYCGVGRGLENSMELADWTTVLRPNCEPCPQHAHCYTDLRTTCDDDYVLKQHPLSFGGLVPLAPTCEADSEKMRGISFLTNAAVQTLRNRAAAVECGEVKIHKGQEEGISEFDLREEFNARKAISDQQFKDLWSHALEELQEKGEIVASRDSGGERYFKSTDLSNISLKCQARRAVTGSLARYRIEIVGLLMASLLMQFLKNQFESNRKYNKDVTRLVSIALRQLAQQQRTHYSGTQPNSVAYIPVAQLRDHVLANEHNAAQRQKLWEGVSKVVEMNSNVRATQMEVMGEVMRCWTWIGSSALLEEAAPQEVIEEERLIGDGRREVVQRRADPYARVLF